MWPDKEEELHGYGDDLKEMEHFKNYFEDKDQILAEWPLLRNRVEAFQKEFTFLGRKFMNIPMHWVSLIWCWVFLQQVLLVREALLIWNWSNPMIIAERDYESDFDSDGEDENEIFEDMIAKY